MARSSLRFCVNNRRPAFRWTMLSLFASIFDPAFAAPVKKVSGEVPLCVSSGLTQKDWSVLNVDIASDGNPVRVVSKSESRLEASRIIVSAVKQWQFYSGWEKKNNIEIYVSCSASAPLPNLQSIYSAKLRDYIESLFEATGRDWNRPPNAASDLVSSDGLSLRDVAIQWISNASEDDHAAKLMAYIALSDVEWSEKIFAKIAKELEFIAGASSRQEFHIARFFAIPQLPASFEPFQARERINEIRVLLETLGQEQSQKNILVWIETELAKTFLKAGDIAAGQSLMERTVAFAERELPKDAPELLYAQFALASILAQDRKFEDAIALVQKTKVPSDQCRFFQDAPQSIGTADNAAPKEFEKKFVEGSVVLEFDVSQSGKAENIRTVVSIPPAILDAPSATILKRRTYLPNISGDGYISCNAAQQLLIWTK
jgi:hypothetical protein